MSSSSVRCPSIKATPLCDLCGCTGAIDHVRVAGAPLPTTRGRRVEVMQSLLRDNDHQAEHNRPHFAETGTFVVNLMSSPSWSFDHRGD
jgi:hydrogenase nickel incorporation protein HypB